MAVVHTLWAAPSRESVEPAGFYDTFTQSSPTLNPFLPARLHTPAPTTSCSPKPSHTEATFSRLGEHVKELENVTKNQSEMKNTITKKKNKLEGINIKSVNTEQISDLEDRMVEIIPEKSKANSKK